MLGTQGYTCSASVADDGSPGGNSIVLTAGHCVYDEAKTDGTGWATNWLFIPDFDAMPNQGFTSSIETCRSASTKYGCWTAISLVAHAKFTTAGGFTSTATRHDFAFAMVGLGGKTGEAKSLDQELGGYRVNTDGGLQSGTSVLSAFGYPAAGKYASGADLVYCSGVIGQDRLNGNATWQLPCDMTGGSSGGPWLAGVNVVQTGPGAGDGGTLNSLNSYGYSGKSFMYGPKFNAETKKVLDRAIANSLSSTTGNAAVS
jgi:V8-like Glu-specific endopeptidase